MKGKKIKESFIYNWKKNKKLAKLIDVFDGQAEIQFVGGCVRDSILGHTVKDFDFAIKCKPESTIQILSKNNIGYELYGLNFGTVTANIDGAKFEITSLRKDTKSNGRFPVIEYTDSWYEDSLRRDFTMNSIYVSTKGDITDNFDGMRDIIESRISFIGNVSERIEEDYLRIVRFYSFMGIFKNPKCYKEDLYTIDRNINYLRTNVSRKKILSEIKKMMHRPFPHNCYFLLEQDSGLRKNNLLKNIQQWWIEDRYSEGLEILNKQMVVT